MTDGVIPKTIPRSDVEEAKQYLLEKYASLSKPLEDREALAKWRQVHMSSLKEKQEVLKEKLYSELKQLNEESIVTGEEASADDISSITNSTYTRDFHLPNHNRVLQAPGGTSTLSLAHDLIPQVELDLVCEVEEDEAEAAEPVQTSEPTVLDEENSIVSMNDIEVENESESDAESGDNEESTSMTTKNSGSNEDMSVLSDDGEVADRTDKSSGEEPNADDAAKHIMRNSGLICYLLPCL